MEILKNIEILDLCLYLKKYKILVVGDIHLGYEESLKERGVLVPRIQFKDIYDKLKDILDSRNIKAIVVIGDLKHEFGRSRFSERKDVLEIINLFLEKNRKLILIKGNHDVVLPYIISKRNIDLVDYFKIDDIILCHGDKLVDVSKSKIIIIGHEHPAVGIREKAKYEKFKCFLRGKYKKKDLIVLPSFNLLTVGVDVLGKKLNSPFLDKGLGKFEAYVVEKDKVYKFKLKG